MTTYKDTDLREALRRKYANTPQLPSDFMNRMHKASQSKPQRASLSPPLREGSGVGLHRASTPLHYGRLASLEQPLNVAAAPQRGANPHSRRRAGWGWVCSIAAALLIAFLLWPEIHKETTTQQEVKPIVAKAEPQPVPQPIVEETKEEVLTEAQPTPQLVREQRKAVKKHSDPIEEPVLAQAEPVIAESELKESNPEEDVPLIPAHKQALADIFLAEEALQVAYELQAQQEAIRAYASSITGEEMPGPIIAF